MNLFYASSVYHELLFHIIAAMECRNEENIIFLSSEQAGLRSTQELFSKLLPGIFSKVFYLKHTDMHNNFMRYLNQKENLRSIKAAMKTFSNIDKFYYSCDYKVDIAYISSCIKNDTLFCYCEDGVENYLNCQPITRNKLEKIGERLLFGKWRTDPEYDGLLNKTAQIYAIFPELLPAVYDNNTKIRIDNNKFLASIQFTDIPAELIKYREKNIGVFIALPSFIQMNNSYINILRNEIAKADEQGLVVVIKKHPKDTDYDMLKLLNVTGRLIELPYNYPAEFYYLFFNKSLKRVIGSTSTSMLTAKWLLPEAEIVSLYTDSLMKLVSYSNKLLDMFRTVGIDTQKMPE